MVLSEWKVYRTYRFIPELVSTTRIENRARTVPDRNPNQFPTMQLDRMRFFPIHGVPGTVRKSHFARPYIAEIIKPVLHDEMEFGTIHLIVSPLDNNAEPTDKNKAIIERFCPYTTGPIPGGPSHPPTPTRMRLNLFNLNSERSEKQIWRGRAISPFQVILKMRIWCWNRLTLDELFSGTGRKTAMWDVENNTEWGIYD